MSVSQGIGVITDDANCWVLEVLLSWDLVETFSKHAFVNISPLLLSC